MIDMQEWDMTSPQECEKQAKYIADQPTQERRHEALFEIKGRHSDSVGEYIEKLAKRYYVDRVKREKGK